MDGKRNRGRVTSGLACAMALLILAGTVASAQQRVADANANAERAVTDRRITLTVQDAPLIDALRRIATEAALSLVFNESILPLHTRVTFQVKDIPVEEAFGLALRGTGLVASVRASGYVGIARLAGADSTAVAGSISGRVIDSASGNGVAQVAVSVSGHNISAVTDARGAFVLARVPAGTHSLVMRGLGYRSITAQVSVEDGRQSTVRIVTSPVASVLAGVVTTATGIQRKVEVGNDITSIAVDSVLKTMPVATLTDLLATRVPGLTVAPTSGAPGAPSRIRIRGLSSINATNDPIIILDGIRMYAAQTALGTDINGAPVDDRTRNLAATGTSPLVPSPLDQIDPNSLEKVEVLKGPSAVALYGSDAANGVIVLTTKHGTPGPAQLSVSTAVGTQFIPGKWPQNYYMWGHLLDDPDQLPTQCGLGGPQSVVGPCADDSLVTYQIMNAPSTTALGNGTTQTYRADVRGGVRALRYAFSGSADATLGLIKMPDADVAALRSLGRPVPDWEQRPQADQTQSGSARIDADVNQQVTISFSSLLNRKFTRTTPLDQALRIAATLPPPVQVGEDAAPSALTASGLLQGIPDFATKNSTQTFRTTNALTASGQTARAINLTATAGVDFTNRRDLSSLARGDCFDDFGSLSNIPSCPVTRKAGFYNTANGSATTTSLDLGLSVPLAFGHLFSLRTSIGGNYAKSANDDIILQASDIPAGATSGNGAATIATSEVTDDRSTAGIYLETVVGIADRLFIPLAFRMDAGNTLGAHVTPAFPKLSVSYVASDEPKFRAVPLVGRLNTLRLRMAYGRAGVQPDITAKLRTYGEQATSLDGTFVALSSIGNNELRPERTTELEGGFDADAWRNRINLGMTWYRKHTVDALITQTLPPSLGLVASGGGTSGSWSYGTPSWQENIGVVDNTGMEVTVGATPLESQTLSWSFNVGLSWNRNRLVRKARSATDAGTVQVGGVGGFALATGSVFSRFVEGYPLYGYWTYPITGYADLNGDGVIQGGEVQVGDSASYVGAPFPNYTASFHHTVTLCSRVTVGATFSYENGLTQVNGLLAGAGNIQYTQAYNDPSISQATQAYLIAALVPGAGRAGSAMGFIQTVSELRFNALSVGYAVPASMTRSILRGRNLHVAVQGTNLGLWTNYRGKDPDVSMGMTELVRDFGVLPTPRAWQLSLRID